MRKKIKQWFLSKGRFNANKLAKKEQMKHAGILLIIAGASVGFYVYSTSAHKTPVKKEEAHFDGTFDSKFTQASDEALIEKQQGQIDELKTLIATNEKKQMDVEKKETPDKDTKALMQTMLEKLNALEEDNKKTKEELQIALLASQQVRQSAPKKPPTRQEMEAQRLQRLKAQRALYSNAGLETVRFNARKKKHKEERTSKNYVWAGTFAEGVLLTGILGDAGINGSKNMGTALIRLTSGGIMPNNQRSRLEDCSALVSTYGDLSGSSVVMHLQTLSCAGKEINFEQKVYGTVFDLDAMQDLRGTSILKTKPLLGYSAAAGMLAGFGDGLKNIGTAQSINPGAGSITTYSTASSLGQSAAGGALSNPANRISDYIMRIADIYHPLVAARAGRHVSVLFTKGFWIDKEHQVYESGKAIDDKQAQNETSVTTTVTRAASTEQVITGDNPEQINTPLTTMPSRHIEEEFLKQQGASPGPFFSPIQPMESSHD